MLDSWLRRFGWDEWLSEEFPDELICWKTGLMVIEREGKLMRARRRGRAYILQVHG